MKSPRARRTIRTAALLSAALLCAIVASTGSAQRDHSTVLRVLEDGRDFRARVRAALALGSSNDRSVAPHLIEALSDRSAAVRAAAATALGRLGDPSAIEPLRRAMRDRAQVVRTEARRALARIEANATPRRPSAPRRSLTRTASGRVLPSISVMPEARRINWRVVRYVVVLGDLENRSRFRHDGLSALLEREVLRNLTVLRGVAALADGRIPNEVRRQIERRDLPTLRLEGSLNRVERRARRRELSVRCEISLMLLDEPGNIRSVLNGAATGSAPRRGERRQQERRLAEQALSGAVRSAMGGAARAIANAGR